MFKRRRTKPVVVGPRTIEPAPTGAAITYQLERSSRRTIGITVFPDGTVRVRAPLRTAEAEVRAVVQHRAEWIERTRARLAGKTAHGPGRTGLIDPRAGGFIFLTGTRYAILLEPQPHRGSSCRLDPHNSQLIVTLGPGPGSAARLPTIVLAWLNGYAQQLISARLAALIAADPRLAHLCGGQATRPFRLRRMRARWGSCSSRGALLFNTLLVCLPPACVDYVIIHELCHLQHHNHGPGFYALLQELRPSWKADRTLLRSFV